METKLTIKWLKKVIDNTVIEMGKTKDVTRMVNLGGKLRAYRDCLEFINAHPSDPAVRGFKDDNSLI